MATSSGRWRAYIGGLPLNTPAWGVVDFSDLFAGPAVRGSDVRIPYLPGDSPRRRLVSAVRKSLPMEIIGHVDSDGNAHTDVDTGLVANLDELKAALRPRGVTATTKLRVRFPDASNREADCIVELPLQIETVGPGFARAVVDVLIPGGVLYSDTSVNETWTTSGTKTINNPGTANAFASTIVLTGAQKITNNSFGGAWLDYSGSLDVTIDTATFTATYVGSGESANEEVTYGGHESWLPLTVGDNEIVLTTNANVSWTFYPPYL